MGQPPPLIEVACWAHARRNLHDVHAATGSPIAAEALIRIGRLFEVEREAHGRPPDERQRIRQEKARPLLDELAGFFDATLPKLSGKSELAAAIRYARSRWAALGRYLEDGRLEMTNNAAERAIQAPPRHQSHLHQRISEHRPTRRLPPRVHEFPTEAVQP